VDPAPTTNGKGYTAIYHQSSDDFFATQTAFLNLSVVLIDGLHHADQVMRDVLNCLRHLNPRGTVVLHDCNPPDEVSQMVPRPPGQNHWNGDCWKVIPLLRAHRADLRVYTLDMDEGLGIIMRSPHPQDLIPDPGFLTWERFVANRKDWLGLVRP